MILGEPFEAFVNAAPISVMMRAVMENTFNPQRLDEIFDQTAESQYTRLLSFSTYERLCCPRRTRIERPDQSIVRRLFLKAPYLVKSGANLLMKYEKQEAWLNYDTRVKIKRDGIQVEQGELYVLKGRELVQYWQACTSGI